MQIVSDKVRKQSDATTWSLGEALYLDNKVDILHVRNAYTDELGVEVYDVTAKVQGARYRDYDVRVWVSEENLLNAYCNCNEFHVKSSYYSANQEVAPCKHIAAVIRALMEEQSQPKKRIQSNRKVSTLIGKYVAEEVVTTIVQYQREKLEIEPKLEYDGNYRLTFRIGAAKKYVIKDLYEFTRRMRENEEVEYGKDLTVLHTMNSFTEESQQLVRFIMNCVHENEIAMQQISNSYIRFSFDKRGLPLSPAVMEDFFPLVEHKTLLFLDKTDAQGSKKAMELMCKPGYEKLKLWVQPYTRKDLLHDRGLANKYGKKDATANDVEGLKVRVSPCHYIKGQAHIYMITPGCLYQTEDAYYHAMLPLLQALDAGDETEFVVGEADIGVFYQNVLDKIASYIDLDEVGRQQIANYLPKEARYDFYLDQEDAKVSCQVKVSYGDEQMDILAEKENAKVVRNIAEEMDRYYLVKHYFEQYDDHTHTFYTEDEDQLYELMLDGIDAFKEVGEVHATNAFRKLKVHGSPKINVGVSISNDLLNLDITSDDFDFSQLSDILSSYRLKKKYHRMKNGEFIQMEENSLEQLIELMEGTHLTAKDLVNGNIRIPAYRALYVDKVLSESEGIEYSRDVRIKKLLRNWKSMEESDYEITKELTSILRGYQKTGYRWLRTIDDCGFGGILADDMGLGKTLQMISVFCAKKEEGVKGTSLVICPASLVYNWEREFSSYAPQLRVVPVVGGASEREEIIRTYEEYDVLVTSYDLLKRDILRYEGKQFLYEVIDEAQYIKNHTTQAAKAVKVIQANTRFALTGTPIENRLSELWSIFDYLMPGYLYTYEQFKKELELPIVKKQEERFMERLKRMVQPFILRRIKQNVLKELPDKLEQITYSKLEGEQQKIYDAYVAKMKEQLAEQSQEEFAKNKLKILSDLMRLRQICCDPRLCYENYTGESSKLATCMELLDNAIEGGHKVLVFSQFTSMLAILANELDTRGIQYYQLTGETSKQKRMQLVTQFNEDDTSVFLISLKAGGTGLNLTGADVVIHYDPWWNLAAQNQATDRAHRIGQKNVVTVFQLIMKQTIEEKIQKLQESKKDLADQILHGEMNHLSQMTKDDFMELLR